MTSPRRVSPRDFQWIQKALAYRGFKLTLKQVHERFPLSGLSLHGCAGFLYTTPTKVAYLDGFTCLPNLPMSIRRSSFTRIIRGLLLLARVMKYDVIMAHTGHRNLLEVVYNLGFQLGDKNTFLIKEIR